MENTASPLMHRHVMNIICVHKFFYIDLYIVFELELFQTVFSLLKNIMAALQRKNIAAGCDVIIEC